MNHLICRVTAFKHVRPYTSQAIDFQPVLEGELYGSWHDLSLFGEARLDPEAHSLVWPNGADFASATLHDWPKSDTLTGMAKRWALAEA